MKWSFLLFSTHKVTKTVELLTDVATVSKSFVSNLMKQLGSICFGDGA
ncbi:hypothetical protein [Enterococcus faecium]